MLAFFVWAVTPECDGLPDLHFVGACPDFSGLSPTKKRIFSIMKNEMIFL
jgi:hypothetical protein